MRILKSLVAAPLLICGAAICSPVSAETVINNDITPVLSPAAKKALKDLRAKDPSAIINIRHRLKWGDLQGCPGGVENGCEPNNTYSKLINTLEVTE